MYLVFGFILKLAPMNRRGKGISAVCTHAIRWPIVPPCQSLVTPQGNYNVALRRHIKPAWHCCYSFLLFQAIPAPHHLGTVVWLSLLIDSTLQPLQNSCVSWQAILRPHHQLPSCFGTGIMVTFSRRGSHYRFTTNGSYDGSANLRWPL